MSRRGRDPGPGEGRRRGDPALSGDPLDLIRDDHLRERQICAHIDALARSAEPDPQLAAEALDFLRRELPRHQQDEEEDLFPLLRRRCTPEDEIEALIARLADDHAEAAAGLPAVLAVLAAIAGGEPAPTPEARSLLAAHAARARRHLILENAIILPFARLRLGASDLEDLRQRIGQRRRAQTAAGRDHGG
ncbi:hemerythrin domain-containing protein [Albidovulum sp.]